ncbi:hypothetical protein KBC01_02065 [Candidatus Parcubacteria bacterium]|nr:hypothetical protein [Candidatus Parcubacteria bacterium]
MKDNDFAEKFAFFVHPRVSAIEDMGKVFKPIAWIGKILTGKAKLWFENFLRNFSMRIGPMAFPCRIHGKRKPIGWIIVIPFMGESLLSIKHRESALKCMEEGVKLASKLGAKIIGLGALTAPATHGGRDLLGIARRCNVFITNGNSLTGGITAQTAIDIAEEFKIDLNSQKISILGAAGSVGRSVSETLLKKGHKILCIDINLAKIKSFEQTMIESDLGTNLEISTDQLRVGEGSLSILVTNGCREFLDNHLNIFKPGSVILDDTQPRALKRNPNESIVIDGGVLMTPSIKYGIDIGLDSHLAYACLGETILMAYEGRLENHIGDCTAESSAKEIESFMRNQHIIKVAPFRSFGKNIKAKQIV